MVGPDGRKPDEESAEKTPPNEREETIEQTAPADAERPAEPGDADGQPV